jgi:multidrug resistance efflux pump
MFDSGPNISQLKHVQEILLNIQRLSVQAFNAQNLQNLIFIILNDTYQVIKYDRAALFRIHPEKVEILGVSGQSHLNLQTELASRLKTAVQNLKNKSDQRVLKNEDFSDGPDNWPTVYWIPIPLENEQLGLWLEKYDDPNAGANFEVYAPLIKEMLLPAYSAAWNKMSSHASIYRLKPYFNLRNAGVLSLLLLLIFFFVPVRLRVVAPCEVVAVDSFVVAAPIEGIIEKIHVDPGQEVAEKQVLYEYDKKVPYHKYQALLKQVEILEAELNQAYVLSTAHDPEATSKLAELEYKLKKSKVDLAFAEKELVLLVEKSPIDGLVSVDNPDDWRGKPVKVGEKIMTVSNQNQTKVRIWIPERDNIEFAMDKPIDIFLNSTPSKTYEAKFLFVSPEVKVTGGELPSFEAEAEWVKPENSPKLGLKGYAVIYGEKVSLVYYLLRKPIGTIRKFIGI